MDVLGPWTWKELWEHQDPVEKLKEWDFVVEEMESGYKSLIEQKQNLCTDYEIIMDSKTRNEYYIKHRKLNYNTRLRVKDWNTKEHNLEMGLDEDMKQNMNLNSVIVLPNEDLDNWDDNL